MIWHFSKADSYRI